MSQAATMPPDRGLLRRWLTALGLLATAEELVRRGDDAASSTALIAADSASETLLGILGIGSALSLPPEPKYHQVIERARDGLASASIFFPVALQQDLRSAHASRNSVVHHGATAPQQVAALACRSARLLLDMLPQASAAFGLLPAGAGIVTGIAALMNAPELTEQLRLGEAAATQGDATAAADAAARAHTELLFRLDPPVTGQRYPPLWAQEKQELGRAGDYIAYLAKSLGRVQGWVLASALGMSPATYGRFEGITGDHVQFLGGNDMVIRRTEPTVDDARWAVVQVAEMAFRLWELGTLIEGTWDDVIRRQHPTLGG